MSDSFPAGNPVPTIWPELSYAAWRDTCQTLHLWTQMVGKVRLAQSPWLNHSWHVALYVTARGLTTGTMPHAGRAFRIEFDFVDHRLRMDSSDGRSSSFALRPMSVAAFYDELFGALSALHLPVRIHRRPNEIADPIPFPEDHVHAGYDGDYAQRFWRALLSSKRVFERFRADFVGKCSPVHFFWGSFDLAVTRFSGRRAPVHPGGIPNLPDWVSRDAYSHEVSSAGFWPGNDAFPQAAYYSYAYPAPEGFAHADVAPREATFAAELGEFVLPYESVRCAAQPEQTLLEFLRSTYVAAAQAAAWDRQTLERDEQPHAGR